MLARSRGLPRVAQMARRHWRGPWCLSVTGAAAAASRVGARGTAPPLLPPAPRQQDRRGVARAPTLRGPRSPEVPCVAKALCAESHTESRRASLFFFRALSRAAVTLLSALFTRGPFLLTAHKKGLQLRESQLRSFTGALCGISTSSAATGSSFQTQDYVGEYQLAEFKVVYGLILYT